MSTAPATTEDSVLILGGCGFLGYHLVRHFVEHSAFSSISVVSRSAATNKNQVNGAEYYCGDLTDRNSLERLFLQIKPALVIHAASPSPLTGTPKDYETVTIRGTQNLLELAKNSKYVRALIFTSSSTIALGAEHLNLTEDCALANEDQDAPPYARAKALAEIMVLKANEPINNTTKDLSLVGSLSTASLRLPVVYGSHDTQGIPGCLKAVQDGQTNVILGDGKNLWTFCSVENASLGHSLLASALLHPNTSLPRADGETFNINDGIFRPFWSYVSTAWKLAGHKPRPNEKIWHLPSKALLMLAFCLEWAFWVFTLGSKRPFKLGKQQVEYMCFTHTYSIEKARKTLGFEPKDDFDRVMKEAVTWSLEHDGWEAKLKKRTR